jgi:hypothetical protein
MIQAVAEDEERGALGMHYTTRFDRLNEVYAKRISAIPDPDA